MNARETIRRCALTLLSNRPYSRAALRKLLAKHSSQEGDLEEVLDNLERVGLIDDAQYARDIVASYLRKEPVGESFLIQKLRMRGIEPSHCEQVVKEALAGRDILKDASFCLEIRMRSLPRHLSGERAARRLYNALLRRGFPSDVARQAVQSAGLTELRDQ